MMPPPTRATSTRASGFTIDWRAYNARIPDSEHFLREFHAAHAGITSRVWARGGSYARLAARARGRVLDLGCGDAPLGVGLDLSIDELRRATGVRVQGRAQQLPFAGGAFDTIVSHLAFVLFDPLEPVVAEIGRVLAPGGRFLAVVGGGPTATGTDAFHRFLALARPEGPRLGDPRAASEAGWRALFAGWDVDFERWEVDLGGPFDEVYAFLSSGYQTHKDVRSELRTELGDTAPCRAVLWCATACRA
jgi:SAM-dependent methyltransferase